MEEVFQAGEMIEKGVLDLVTAVVYQPVLICLAPIGPPAFRLQRRVLQVQSSALRLSSHLGTAESCIILCHVK